MGAQKQHVKLWVKDTPSPQGGSGAASCGVTHEAVWWNGGDKSLPVEKFDLAFAPSVNEFNGRRTVQLKVLDWRAVE
jgi:hypothetical protein